MKKIPVYVRLPKEMNHSPEDIGVWVPYDGWRYKDVYDIRLKDGTVHPNMKPNSYYWTPGYSTRSGMVREVPINDPIHDFEVVAIRLMSEDDPHYPKFHQMGKRRIDRNYEMFGIPVDKNGRDLDIELDSNIHELIPYQNNPTQK